MTDLKRQQFEAHLSHPGISGNLMRSGDDYVDMHTYIKWKLWQAAWDAALASQQPAGDGWIEWAGGYCPVNINSLVNVRYKNGGEDLESRRAEVYNWSHNDKDCYPIIAYRVVKP